MNMRVLILLMGVLSSCASGSFGKKKDCEDGTGLGEDGRCHPVCQTVEDCGDCQECRNFLCHDLQPCPSLCGNGELDPGEQCDDGNTVTETCPPGERICTVCNASCQWQEVDLTACGDGEKSGNEECDDGNIEPGDGCGADCTVETGWSCDPVSEPSVCMRLPGAVVIEGEASAGHTELFWRWNTPEHASFFRVRTDGVNWQDQTEAHCELDVSGPGMVTIEVQACNVQEACGPMASFTTHVIFYGTAWRPVWRGVQKADLTVSPLGQAVPVSCHNCYNGPSDEVYTTSQALTKIHTAITRGADLIELDIADSAGTLCVTHDDVATCNDRPTLPEILSDATLLDADALLFIEIKEGTADPDAFAVALLDLLDSRRRLVRNGRPVFIRAFASRENYLVAVKNRLHQYPFIRHYVRFSVLYGRNAHAAVATFQNAIVRVKNDLGFDMVEFEYRQKNLLGLTMLARAIGLGTGVYTIPGSFGEAFIAGLRHEVDQITAEFRADYARSVIEETNLLAYVNVSGCSGTSDSHVQVYANTAGTLDSTATTVGVAPTANSFGRPPLMHDPIGEDRYGCSLDFRLNHGITGRALPLGSGSSQSTQGYLVTAYVNFDDLAVNGTLALVNNSEAGGFAMELQGNGSTVNLRFGVHVNGAYRYHSYNVSATGLSNNPSLNGTDGYFLIGAYDGDGGVYLWVDQQASGNGGTFTGNVTSSSQQVLIGADPQPSELTGARFHFDGIIQQISVLDWVDHSFPAPLVN